VVSVTVPFFITSKPSTLTFIFSESSAVEEFAFTVNVNVMLEFVGRSESVHILPDILDALSPVKLTMLQPVGTSIVRFTFVKLFPLFVIVIFVSASLQGVVAMLFVGITVRFDIPKNISLVSLLLHAEHNLSVTSKAVTLATFVNVPVVLEVTLNSIVNELFPDAADGIVKYCHVNIFPPITGS